MAFKEILQKYSKDEMKKAAQIKALFFEVDGVLTDGKILLDESGKELKQFHVRDSYILSRLKDAGILVGIISSRESPAVTKWAAENRLDFCHQGIIDKLTTFEKLVGYYKMKKKQVAFVGSEINDLGIFESSGLSVCPADAPEYISGRVDTMTRSKGGQGVVREIADRLLASQGRLDKILKDF